MRFDFVFIMKYADESISSSKLARRSKHKSKIGIIIPTLNEEKSIGLVMNELKRELGQFDCMIIVVDGRSTDRTISVAKENGAEVIYQKNKGYGDALIAGYFYAARELQCDILVTIDADGTYSAIGDYVSPASDEKINVTITLKGGIITDAGFSGQTLNPTSRMMQSHFADGFKEQVVGKSIDSVSLIEVNGSSLVPKGFMDALEKIKLQASKA